MTQSWKPWRSALFSAIVLAGVGWLYFLHSQYPVYFMWDMDLSTTIDAILIQSRMIPVHLNHTGFGMYLLVSHLHRMLFAAGQISVQTLEDLRQSLNPVLGADELMGAIRSLTLACVALIPFLGLSVFRRARALGFGVSCAILVFLFSQESLAYQATMVRSELYAMMFWLLALIPGVAGLQRLDGRRDRSGIWLLGLSGVFAGVSFLTKIQGIFYLLALPFALELLVRGTGPAASGSSIPLVWLRRGAVASLAAFAALALFSWRAIEPRYYATFAESYRPNLTFYLFSLIYLGTAVLAFLGVASRGAGKRWLAILVAIGAGFLASYLLHFLVFGSFQTSLQYLLWDAKMVLFRQTYHSGDALSPHLWWWTVSNSVRRNPALLFAHLVLWAASFRGASKNDRALLVVALGCVLLNYGFAFRGVLRDLIWQETMLNLFSVAYALRWIEARAAKNGARGARELVLGLFALVLVGNFAQLSGLRHAIDATYPEYGWSIAEPARAVYAASQNIYGEIMNEAFLEPGEKGPRKKMPSLMAAYYRRVKRDAGFVFFNRAVDLRSIGVFEPGYRLYRGDLETRLTGVEGSLIGGWVVDFLAGEADGCSLDLATVHLDNIALRRCASGVATLLPRTDLAVYLFLPVLPGTTPTLGKWFQETTLRATAGSASRQIEFRAWKLVAPGELQLGTLPREAFVVIQPNRT